MTTLIEKPTAVPARVSEPLSFKVKHFEDLKIGNDHTQDLGPNYIIVVDRPPKNPAPQSNASFVRQATGGLEPYTYSSSNPKIAVVFDGGRVVATGTGTATITVSDKRGSKASYSIRFNGVVRLVTRRDNNFWPVPASNPARPEHFAISLAQMQAFWSQYKDEDTGRSVPQILRWPDTEYWSAENFLGDGRAWAVNLNAITPNFNGVLRAGGTVLPAIARLGW